MEPAIMYIATSFHFRSSLSHFTLFHLTLDWLLEFFDICYEQLRLKYIEFGFGGIYIFWFTITFINSSSFSSCPRIFLLLMVYHHVKVRGQRSHMGPHFKVPRTSDVWVVVAKQGLKCKEPKLVCAKIFQSSVW